MPAYVINDYKAFGWNSLRYDFMLLKHDEIYLITWHLVEIETKSLNGNCRQVLEIDYQTIRRELVKGVLCQRPV